MNIAEPIKIHTLLFQLLRPATLLVLFAIASVPMRAAAQGTAFTYQGGLNAGGVPANGSFDVTFTLYTSSGGVTPVAGPVTNVATLVSNGLFSTMVDFGAGSFTGTSNWLELGVRTNGGGAFSTLAPRQQLTPMPYSILTEGTVPGAITGNMIASGAVTTDKIAPGAVTSDRIDDGGAAAYQAVQQNLVANGGDGSVALSGMESFPITAKPSFALTINGAAFGTVLGFSGTEGISQPYSYLVEVQSTAAPINPDSELNLTGQLTFRRYGRATSFSGVVTACALSGSNSIGLLYLVKIESPLASLAHTTDYRIFQDQSATDVVHQIFADYASGTLTSGVGPGYVKHSFVVQYGETALNFFNRILENEGIFYLFDYSTATPGVVLGDSTSAYASGSTYPYYGNGATGIAAGSEYIRTFQNASHQSTLQTVIDSYNYLTPGSLAATNTAVEGIGQNYEFGTGPGQSAAYNQQLADVRQGRQAVERALISGAATAPDLRAGWVFGVTDNTSAGLGGSYVVTSVHHAGFIRVTNGVSTLFYGNQFAAIPASMVFRPALATPKPLAQPCAAVVVGPGGSTAYTIEADEYGRIRVQFKWDRRGKFDDNSSAWLRVALPMAGATHGALFLPRVGDDVLVSFVQGDPDEPIVTGSFYNAIAKPPVSLPGNKTVSVITSTSSDGGVNKIQFDDKPGAEYFDIDAAKDMDLAAINNLKIEAGGDVLLSGNVGINTTSPGSASLYVLGGQTGGWTNSISYFVNTNRTVTNSPALRVVNVGGTNMDGALSVSANVPPTGAGGLIAEFGNASSFVLTVTNDGSIYCAGDVYSRGLKLTSDRNAKENFKPVDSGSVLAKVATLPVTEWNYRDDASGGRHIGPVAQDFHAAFGLNGGDDKHISAGDEGGVALAAIQGLQKELAERDARIKELEGRLDKLERLITAGGAKSAK